MRINPLAHFGSHRVPLTKVQRQENFVNGSMRFTLEQLPEELTYACRKGEESVCLDKTLQVEGKNYPIEIGILYTPPGLYTSPKKSEGTGFVQLKLTTPKGDYTLSGEVTTKPSSKNLWLNVRHQQREFEAIRIKKKLNLLAAQRVAKIVAQAAGWKNFPIMFADELESNQLNLFED
jgi:hypothetical protein